MRDSAHTKLRLGKVYDLMLVEIPVSVGNIQVRKVKEYFHPQTGAAQGALNQGYNPQLLQWKCLFVLTWCCTEQLAWQTE